LQRTFYFHRQPGVRRAVFIGTPHRGSRVSDSFVGRLGARLAGIPRRLMTTAQEVSTYNPDSSSAEKAKAVPTSIDLLDPASPAIQLLAHRPRPPEVHYHSIIGLAPPSSLIVERLLGGGWRSELTDGVVPYRSAHLDDVDSELTVSADHYTVHQHP